MSTAVNTHRASLSVTGRIVIRGPYSPDLLEFYRALPNVRWDGVNYLWTCDFTPATAWKLWTRDEGFDLAPAITEAAQRFAAQIELSREGVIRQPELRKNDSWRHQLPGYNYIITLDACLLAMGMGTGKSKVLVDAAANVGAEKILIICPTSVRGVWRREFHKHSAVDYAVVVIDKGTAAAKAKAMNAAYRVSKRLVIVVNYESAWRGELAKEILAHTWDMVACDESHRIKSNTSLVSRFCAKLTRVAKKRLCLTGTPMGQSPLDLFGQFRFLDPGLFGTSWFHFSHRYARFGNSIIPQQITGYQNQDELQAAMKLLTYRVGSEVLDLPPEQHIDLDVTLTGEARRVYGELENDLVAKVASGEVVVSNALAKLMRLQQVTSGFIPDENDNINELGTDKLDVLEDLLTDLGPGEPVVVFSRFRHDLHKIRAVADKLGRRYGELSGESHSGLTDTGEMSPNINVLGVQIQSGGVGVDLTRARYAIYYSLGFSLLDFEQSLKRVHRPGQTRPVVYYHLICEGTVDRRVYRALQSKRDVIEAVLEGLKHERD